MYWKKKNKAEKKPPQNGFMKEIRIEYWLMNKIERKHLPRIIMSQSPQTEPKKACWEHQVAFVGA